LLRKKTTATKGLCLLLALSSSCLFDSSVPWQKGPYALSWIDDPDDVELTYDLGKGSRIGRVEATVFAVGADERYVVAKQHPRGNKSITNYFIIQVGKDSANANPKDVVIGPLAEDAFKRMAVELQLPAFTTVLQSLE
jgi:hypothetical protein